MKFLILTLCVCAASAASFDGKPYKPYQSVKQFQGFRQVEASPFVASKSTYNAAQIVANSPIIAAKNTYNAAKFVATAPVVAAKTTYNTAKFVANSPVVATKTNYDAAKLVATAPVAAAKTTYNAAQFVANSPVVAAKTTYDAAKFVSNSPVVAAKTTYNSANIVASAPVVAGQTTYDAAKFVVASPVVADSVVIGAKSVYNVHQPINTSPIVAEPVVATKAAYDNSRVLTIAPKTIYNAGKEAEANIVRSDSDVTAEGYNYAFKTSNGIEAQSNGALKAVEGANVLVSQGSYQYTAPDGTLVKFEYVADENGYQPRSDLLPVAPPVPKLIAESLEYLRTHPSKPENY